MSDRLIPLAAMEQLLKNAGANRVSDNAKAALKDILEEKAESISKRAIEIALHTGRKTVKAEDIKLASKQ